MPDPVLIIANRDSGGSLLAALLGAHPAFHAAPHLNALAFPLAWQLRLYARIPRDSHVHGLWRFLGQHLMDEQTVLSVQAARRWLGRRDDLPAGELHRDLQALAAPRRLVDYSPLIAQNADAMRRALAAVPEARVIHLVRNPVTHGIASRLPVWQTLTASLGWWPDRALNQPCMDAYELGEQYIDWSVTPVVFDTQFAWYRTQSAALAVEAEQPPGRWLRLEAETLAAEPEAALARVLHHLGADAAPDLIRAMMAAGTTPYSHVGPFEAPFGIDYDMIGRTVAEVLRQAPPDAPLDADTPVSWRGDGDGLVPEVVGLAELLGYRVQRARAGAALRG